MGRARTELDGATAREHHCGGLRLLPTNATITSASAQILLAGTTAADYACSLSTMAEAATVSLKLVAASRWDYALLLSAERKAEWHDLAIFHLHDEARGKLRARIQSR